MKKGKYLVCPICNKAFYAKPDRLKDHKNFYCSHKCHHEHTFIMTIQKLSRLHSESLKNLIYRWYINDKISMREITKKLRVNYRTTQKIFKTFKIPQRSIHDRIALQWINNPKRKKELGKRTARLLKGHAPWNKGQSKETNPSTLRQAEWMTGTNNPMYGKRGRSHPNYKNGKYTAEKKRFWGTSEYRQWRETVYKRDNYTCQKCGDNKGHNFNAHHIKSFVDHPKLRYEISNGITLCKKCHQITHYSVKPEIEHLQSECRGG